MDGRGRRRRASGSRAARPRSASARRVSTLVTLSRAPACGGRLDVAIRLRSSLGTVRVTRALKVSGRCLRARSTSRSATARAIRAALVRSDPVSRTCLVTGAAGFIGSHLCEALLDDGWTVRGLDCLTDFTPLAEKHRRLAALATRGPRFSFVARDLSRGSIDAELAGADVVFHLAGQAGVRDSFGPGLVNHIDRNIRATQCLAEAMRAAAAAAAWCWRARRRSTARRPRPGRCARTPPRAPRRRTG